MRWRGPVGFVLFWIVALAVGTALVLRHVDGGFGWLALAAGPAFALVPIGLFRARHR